MAQDALAREVAARFGPGVGALPPEAVEQALAPPRRAGPDADTLDRAQAIEESARRRQQMQLEAQLHSRQEHLLHLLTRPPRDQLLAWGSNSTGQLGSDDCVPRGEPAPVAALQDVAVRQVVCGSNTTFVVARDGTLYACGSGQQGQLGHGVLADGLLLAPVRPLQGVVVRKVASMGSHTLLLTGAGSIYSFGNGTYGQLGDRDNTPRPVQPAAAAGAAHAPVQQQDDSGSDPDDTASQPRRAVPYRLSRFRRATDGRVPVAVAAGAFHSLILTQDGAVYALGRGDGGQLGVGAAGPGYQTGNFTWVRGLQGHTVVKIACGMWHSAAVTDKGELFTWGRNDNGQLGVGSTHAHDSPQLVQGALQGRRVVAVYCGAQHTVARLSDGAVYAFGCNADGQIGTGSDGDVLAPVLVPFPPGAVKVRAGYSSTLCIAADGVVYYCGDVAGDVARTPTALSLVKDYTCRKLAAGLRHCVVVAERETLADRLRRMVGSAQHADIEFVVRGETIPAHRVLLCAAGDGLERFVRAAPPGRPVPIDIPHVTPALMRLLLGFCYAGYLDAGLLLREPDAYRAPSLDVVSPALQRLAAHLQMPVLEQLVRTVLLCLRKDSAALDAPLPTRDQLWPLPQRLRSMFGAGTLSDVSLVVSGAETGDADAVIPAHQVVLAAASRYFDSLLRFSGDHRRITISEVSADVFRLFLVFVYTGALPPPPLVVSTVCELLVLADMYVMPELRLACVEALAAPAALTPEGALYALRAAALVGSARLEGVAADYVLRHAAQVTAAALARDIGDVDVPAVLARRRARLATLGG